MALHTFLQKNAMPIHQSMIANTIMSNGHSILHYSFPSVVLFPFYLLVSSADYQMPMVANNSSISLSLHPPYRSFHSYSFIIYGHTLSSMQSQESMGAATHSHQ